MNFGELKPGDVLYLIDYNQFKKDLTYIKGLVQTVIVNEPPKENLNNVYQTLMQKTGINQPVQSLTITALFNGVQFPFTVTREWLRDKAIPEGKAFYHYMKHLKHKHKEDRD